MTALDYLIEKKFVKDLKEFQDLYAIRAFKINDKYLSDPNMKIKTQDIKKIEIGYKVFNL